MVVGFARSFGEGGEVFWRIPLPSWLSTNAELAVMELLWGSGPITARQVREHLYIEAGKLTK